MLFGWFKRKRSSAPVNTTPAQPATPPQRTEMPPPPEADLPMFPAEKVAARAYEIWVRKGKPHGRDVQNWLDAEAELRAEFAAHPEPIEPIRKPR